jgi:hypothetical protein
MLPRSPDTSARADAGHIPGKPGRTIIPTTVDLLATLPTDEGPTAALHSPELLATSHRTDCVRRSPPTPVRECGPRARFQEC